MNMILIQTAAQLDELLAQADRKNKTLGFVPTMGYLHEGHMSLIQLAKKQNDLVVVSVFVNPTQFAPGEDFESYPRDIERDYKLAMEAGADFIFHPNAEEIYGPGSSTFVEVAEGITQKLCGASRPTHFKGVTTVVNVLFNLVKPDAAYFGQKDAQQVIILKKMVRDLHIPVKLVVCPIIREEDGLARSSRNVYLNTEERKAAIVLNRALGHADTYLHSGREDSADIKTLKQIITEEIESEALAQIDYVEILDGETLDSIDAILPGKEALAAVAVRFGKTRLIDNRIVSL
jgi:pantoate--beta-alanine ligase